MTALIIIGMPWVNPLFEYPDKLKNIVRKEKPKPPKIPWDGNPDSIKVFQGENGLKKDGLWGPDTQLKYKKVMIGNALGRPQPFKIE